MQRIGRMILMGMLLLATIAGVARAQGDVTLGRNSVEHGGAVAAGGGYMLVAAVGQADAGAMAGGDFVLAGGFLAGAAVEVPTDRALYLPRLGR